MPEQVPFRQGEKVWPKETPVVGNGGLLFGGEELIVHRILPSMHFNPTSGSNFARWLVTFDDIEGEFSAEDFVGEDDAALGV